jgi:hypothetical protein
MRPVERRSVLRDGDGGRPVKEDPRSQQVAGEPPASPGQVVPPVAVSLALTILAFSAPDEPLPQIVITVVSVAVVWWLTVLLARRSKRWKAYLRPTSHFDGVPILWAFAILALPIHASNLWTLFSPVPARYMIAVEYVGPNDRSRIIALEPGDYDQDCSDSFFRISTGPSEARQPTWSPNRTQVVYTQFNDDSGYWTLRLTDIRWQQREGGESTPHPVDGDWITDTPGHGGYHSMRPYWSPNGRFVAYLRARGNTGDDLNSLMSSRVELVVVDMNLRSDVPIIDPKTVSDLYGWAVGEDATLVYRDVNDSVMQVNLTISGRNRNRAPTKLDSVDLNSIGGGAADVDIVVGPQGALLYSGRGESTPPFKVLYTPDASRKLSQDDDIVRPGNHEHSPAFSPDGRRIVYLRGRDAAFQVYEGQIDGAEIRKRNALTECPGSFGAPSW